MGMFYNQAVFDASGLDVPTTWDEFIAAGETLKTSNPDACIINDSGDAGFTMSMIWQAGGRPFKVEGETVSIDLQDDGAKKWADTWNQVIEKDLNCEFPPGTNEWFQALNSGTIATLPAGPWMVSAFPRLVPEGAGQWRVAPMPSYDGKPANAENGGSAQAVMAKAANPALAAAFLRWMSTDEESFAAVPDMFPSTVAQLEDPAFLEAESEYFGGQKVNAVFAEGAPAVGTGWQYLPWQVYANSIVGETIGQAYLNRTDINDGLIAWQDRSKRYAEEQGFDVAD
jgi:multiple sugar transport system substrate-binding protein